MAGTRQAGHRARLWGAGLIILMAAIAVAGMSVEGRAGADTVDPDTRRYLKRMGDYLAAADEFSFTAEVTSDEVAIGIQKIHTTDRVGAVVRRPNRFWLDTGGDLYNKRMWYDGKTVTLLSIEEMFYATTKGADTIDETLDSIMDEYGITTDVVDFLFTNPYDVLIENVTSGVFAGLHEVDGVDCYHLAFTQETLDWQIWIEAGKRSLPRKFVVTYKDEPGSSETVTVFKDWDFSTKHPDGLFVFDPPESARKIEFLPLTQLE